MTPKQLLFIQLGAIVVLGGGIGYGWHVIGQLRQEVYVSQQQLQRNPEEQLRIAQLKNDLVKRRADIERVRHMVLKREELNQIVNTIEAEANRRHLEFSIPEVREQSKTDAQGKALPAGAVQDIRLSITAKGKPEELLSFLHYAEHLPYILYAESWTIKTEQVFLNRSALSVTIPGAVPPPTSSGPPVSTLEAGLIITTANAAPGQ
jgi:hypothetical protein